MTWLLVIALLQAHAEDKPEQYSKSRQAYIKKDEQDRNVLSQIFEMQINLKRINHEKGKLEARKENIDKQIEKLNPLIQSAQAHLQEQKIDLQKRLLYIAKFQDMSFLKVVFSNQSPSELDRNLRILKNFTEKDYLSLKKYFASVKVLEAKKGELSEKIKSVAQLEKEVAGKRDQLQVQTRRKNLLLVDIQNQKKTLVEKLKNIRKLASRNAEDLKKQEFLSTILEPLFFEKKGSLLSPIHGSIVQKYGYFEHPIYKTQIRNKGIFIRAPATAEVKAVAAGSVVFEEKDLLGGYTLIVDHGDHYYSVYSCIGEPAVALDEAINEGQVIAHGVAQHPFLGEGMYFELRHFSEPEDPQPWFTAASRRTL